MAPTDVRGPLASGSGYGAAPMQGIDVERVSGWLAEHVDGLLAPFAFDVIAGGRSNLTYTVTDGNGRKVVLRRPPLGHVLATAHDVGREHRIISALNATPLPVPPALALCTDDAVNGVPFYVMGFVDGVVLDSPDRAAALATERRATAGQSLIDTLAQLHLVDVAGVGLGDLARHDRYVERQLKRWSIQWTNSKTRELPAVEEAERRLRARIPRQQRVSVAHGDYRFGNCLIDVATGHIAAVLDWELCTLGDPLADVGYLLGYWTDPGEPSRRPNDPTGAGGFGSRAALVERYARATGLDLGALDFYVALGAWRLAVIAEGVYARYLAGVMGDATDVDVAGMGDRTARLADEALALV